MPLSLILPIAAGGAIGAVARFLITGVVQRGLGGAFPWGTLAVNVLGALLMGLIVEAGGRLWAASDPVRVFLTTGLLGGFTTFSAFSLETGELIQKGDWLEAAAYVTASVILCVLALFTGMWLIRLAAA